MVVNLILMTYVRIMEDTTFAKILGMLPEKSCVYHLDPKKDTIVTCMVVEMDIGVTISIIVPTLIVMLMKC